MKTETRLGIWMDHATAHLMEFSMTDMKTQTITSRHIEHERDEDQKKSEKLAHNKEQQVLADFYKELGEVIKRYEEVFIFGPTSAKAELVNLLKADHRFEKIKFETQQADKMSETERHNFVKKHFSKDNIFSGS